MSYKLCALLVSVGVLASSPAKAVQKTNPLFSSVPTEAIGVLGVGNLASLDGALQQTAADLGLQPFLVPPMGSLVGAMKQFLPMFPDIDANRSLAVVLMPATTLFELPQRIALMVPAKNPGAMLAALGASGFDPVQPVNVMGKPLFAGTARGYVILGQTPDVVRAVVGSRGSLAQRLVPGEAGALVGLDLLLWLDVERIAELAKPQIAMLAAMVEGTAGSGTVSPTDLLNIRRGKKQLDQLIEGGKSLAIGFALDKPGLGLRFAASARPATDFARRLARIRNTAAPLLRGLPEENWMFSYGKMYDSAAAREVSAGLDDAFDLLEEAIKIDPQQRTQIRTAVEHLSSISTGVRGTVTVLPGGHAGLVAMGIVGDTTDSRLWLTTFRDLFTQVRTVAGSTLTGAKGLSKKERKGMQDFLSGLVYTKNAETIGGVKVDRLTVALPKVDASNPSHVAKIRALLGEDNLVIRTAIADGQTVVMTIGGGQDYMARRLAGAIANKPGPETRPSVQKTASHLPGNRTLVAYFAPDQCLRLVKGITSAMDGNAAPIPFTLPDAPIGLSSSGGESWVRGDVFIPTELLVAFKNIAMFSMMAQTQAPVGAPVAGR